MLVEHYAKLGPEHRLAIARHLRSLDRRARVLRFGASVRDETLTDYAAAIDFQSDIVEGVWYEGWLVGVAHLAVYGEDGDAVGELGISVSSEARGRKLGQRLLARVLLHARIVGLTRVYVHFVTRNRPMARLVRAIADVVEVKQGEARATIDLEDVACAAA